MCWNPLYIILILASTIVDYVSGIMMGRTKRKRVRKVFLIISLLGNLGMLFTYKYYDFFNQSLQKFLGMIDVSYHASNLDLLLPVGISFYTFQTLSYTIDIYRGQRQAEKHFGRFALYVSFFPQLVAGPIERSRRLLPQFYKMVYFDYQRVVDGLKLVLWGLFQKVVIADRLASMVDKVYGSPYEYTGMALLVATILFFFQIFCDFSGYSDIAIGTAKILGFKLSLNFRQPFFATSIIDIWRRWHITLMSWLRDYIYTSLGGGKYGQFRMYLNIFLVFFISGLWHGANWTFVMFGVCHGIFTLLSIWTKPLRSYAVNVLSLKKYPVFHRLLKISLTMGMASFSIIFFRAQSVSEAVYIIKYIVIGILDKRMVDVVFSGFGLGSTRIIIAILSILVLLIVHYIREQGSVLGFLNRQPAIVRYLAYSFIVLSIVFLGNFMANDFIYFQF
jgi:D-alanyl-lipoteichoic acid acyltransferase DltB (MBOAT superfamily)